ncbi:hypothetical protein ACI3L1_00425 [Deinococcus sp. SM5_A1]|uniref:hypothetical protein n=1 Tax=Deinococcus sp. SM5_A1 TaxID=3379094 RepID=UPI00385B72CA
MVEAFRDAGPEGERACVLNILPALGVQITGSVRGMQIDKVTVTDSGDGRARGAIQTMPANIIGLVEQVENATGVNLLSMLQHRVTPGETPAPKETVSAAND